MEKNSKILVLGSSGLVGSAIVRKLEKDRFYNIFRPLRHELNLIDTQTVGSYFRKNKPDYVFVAAAKVGGIMANKTLPATFGYENSMITLNILEAANREESVKKLLFLGSSCIYPKEAPIPIKESSLLSGKLEPTNELYALSKILGIKMCQAYREQYGRNFISCMPCNLYGPRDNFNEQTSHVLPALIRRIYEAKTKNLPSITCWGDGSPLREFLYVDDLAEACLFLMDTYNDSETINVGSNTEISIRNLVNEICSVIGYDGTIEWDISKPNGTMRKTMDTSRLNNLGWSASTSFIDGITKTVEWYKENLVKS